MAQRKHSMLNTKTERNEVCPQHKDRYIQTEDRYRQSEIRDPRIPIGGFRSSSSTFYPAKYHGLLKGSQRELGTSPKIPSRQPSRPRHTPRSFVNTFPEGLLQNYNWLLSCFFKLVLLELFLPTFLLSYLCVSESQTSLQMLMLNSRSNPRPLGDESKMQTKLV